MKNEKFLYCYKMTHDTGFAPNPYYDVLTLATCKPKIRKNAKKEYWISGWTSNVVYGKDNEKHTFTDDDQKLIYLAKVFDNPKIENYWRQYPKNDNLPNLGKPPNQKIARISCQKKLILDVLEITFMNQTSTNPLVLNNIIMHITENKTKSMI